MQFLSKLKVGISLAFVADIATTGIAFLFGAVEANPLMQGWDYWQIVAAKSAVLIVLIMVKKDTLMARIVFLYGICATMGVSLWNGYQLIKYWWWVSLG